jgi:hypothetical protein
MIRCAFRALRETAEKGTRASTAIGRSRLTQPFASPMGGSNSAAVRMLQHVQRRGEQTDQWCHPDDRQQGRPRLLVPGGKIQRARHASSETTRPAILAHPAMATARDSPEFHALIDSAGGMPSRKGIASDGLTWPSANWPTTPMSKPTTHSTRTPLLMTIVVLRMRPPIWATPSSHGKASRRTLRSHRGKAAKTMRARSRRRRARIGDSSAYCPSKPSRKITSQTTATSLIGRSCIAPVPFCTRHR